MIALALDVPLFFLVGMIALIWWAHRPGRLK